MGKQDIYDCTVTSPLYFLSHLFCFTKPKTLAFVRSMNKLWGWRGHNYKMFNMLLTTCSLELLLYKSSPSRHLKGSLVLS